MRTALLLLCGLPGSGKSTLLQTLLSLWRQQEPGLALTVVSVDRLQTGVQYTAAEWHAAREEALRRAREALHGGGEGCCVVVVDDTMFYRSMRRRFFTLAAETRSAFGLIYVQCPLEICLKRNAGRKGAAAVPREVIERAARVFEAPDGEQHCWEKVLHVVDSNSLDVRAASCCEEIAKKLLENWIIAAKMQVSAEVRERRKKLGRSSNQGALHQLDLRTRQAVSHLMSQLQSHRTSADLSRCATLLRRLRSEHLAKFRSSVRGSGAADVEDAFAAFAKEMEQVTS